jgi:hypothetical protein
MFQMATKIMKWISLPALLIASILSRSAASYEFLLDVLICLGSVIFVQWAVRAKQYAWAAGFVAVAVVFSPFLLVVKIFLLTGFTCMLMFVILLGAFRTRPVPAT